MFSDRDPHVAAPRLVEGWCWLILVGFLADYPLFIICLSANYKKREKWEGRQYKTEPVFVLTFLIPYYHSSKE